MTRQEMLRRFKRAGVSSKSYRLDPPRRTLIKDTGSPKPATIGGWYTLRGTSFYMI